LEEREKEYLNNKNDSVIIYRNGFEVKDLPSLFQHAAENPNYLQLFIGDNQTGNLLDAYNTKNGA
jgi:hypothetical protein